MRGSRNRQQSKPTHQPPKSSRALHIRLTHTSINIRRHPKYTLYSKPTRPRRRQPVVESATSEPCLRTGSQRVRPAHRQHQTEDVQAHQTEPVSVVYFHPAAAICQCNLPSSARAVTRLFLTALASPSIRPCPETQPDPHPSFLTSTDTTNFD